MPPTTPPVHDISSLLLASPTSPVLCDALKRFATGESIKRGLVPAHVLRGWTISRKHGIDPWNPTQARILSAEEFRILAEQTATILEAAEPMLKMLEVSIRETGYIATLSTAQGYILAVVGDEELLVQAEQAHNIAGAVRTIESVGASAMTLCVLEKETVRLAGFQHYNSLFHNWICTASPIFDEQNNPIASLALSGLLNAEGKHIKALTESCARLISIRLHERQLLREQQRLSAMVQSVYDALPEAILAVDVDGCISHGNEKATALLGGGPLEGQMLARYMHPKSLPALRAILRKNVAKSAEITLLADGEAVSRSCRFTPIDAFGNNAGMTVTITAIKQLITIATELSGNYAKYSFQNIKGQDPVLRAQIELARRAAATSSTILITGESGTGKELFAQSIHNSSPVREGPFVAISCASIPRDLIESELFGYVGGAFTGARKKGMLGKFELASGGTLFLDEVNSLPFDMQAKLLRVLQQKEIMRIGDTRPIPITTRIIAATNANLLNLIEQGCFRKDLYFRLNVVEILIPSLAQRPKDILLLAQLILQRLCAEKNLPEPVLSPEVKDIFLHYAWPGNVRELDNVCERALLLCNGKSIETEHLPASLLDMRVQSGLGLISSGKNNDINTLYHETLMTVLDKYQGNVSKAAAHLGIARSTLYRRIQRFEGKE